MLSTLSFLCFALAGIGLCLLLLQYTLVVYQRFQPLPEPKTEPGFSILKPLCGVDEDLWDNLEHFATKLDYSRYEIILGVKDTQDPAWPYALKAQQKWPKRYKVVLQQGMPGLNPKVNQLITMVHLARYDCLVLSDANVQVPPNYLKRIAAYLEDPTVGLVTHPVVGRHAKSLGSCLEHQHLAVGISGGMLAAKQILDQDIVVGKSMAFRHKDLQAMGGFTSLKDVLAEDFVFGRRITKELGKSVVVATEPIFNVGRQRSIHDFLARFQRWSVMQRKTVGTPLYLSQALLHPSCFALLGFLLGPSQDSFYLLAQVLFLKGTLDGWQTMLMEGTFWTSCRSLVLALPKDLMIGSAWVHGLLNDTVQWRGKSYRVASDSRLVEQLTSQASDIAHLPPALSPIFDSGPTDPLFGPEQNPQPSSNASTFVGQQQKAA